jgi:hypothetical protein
MKYIDKKIEANKANCFRKDDQGIVRFKDRIVVPKNEEVRQQILDEAHLSRYSIHPGVTPLVLLSLKLEHHIMSIGISCICYT